MRHFLALALIAFGFAVADVDRPITCGSMSTLQPLNVSSAQCLIGTSQQGVATGDSLLLFKVGSTRTPYSTQEFSSTGGKDSIITYITGQRRDADDVSMIFQILYKFPGATNYVAVGGNDTLTFGANISTVRIRRPLLPGLPFIPVAYVNTTTDSMGVLGAYFFNK